MNEADIRPRMRVRVYVDAGCRYELMGHGIKPEVNGRAGTVRRKLHGKRQARFFLDHLFEVCLDVLPGEALLTVSDCAPLQCFAAYELEPTTEPAPAGA